MKHLPNMNDQHFWIVASLAIHGSVLFLLLMGPAKNMIPNVKTIQVHLVQQDKFSTERHETIKPAAGSKTEQIQNISKQESNEIKQDKHEERNFIIKEERTVLAAGQITETATSAGKSENQGIVQAETITARKMGNQAITETKFGDTGAPAFIHREMPVYPILARRLGKEGKVVLKLLINANGKLQRIDVIEPSWVGFTEAAIEAIKKSIFSPAHRNGEAIVSKAILSVRFNLK
jgi:periplasmic protein TonB